MNEVKSWYNCEEKWISSKNKKSNFHEKGEKVVRGNQKLFTRK